MSRTFPLFAFLLLAVSAMMSGCAFGLHDEGPAWPSGPLIIYDWACTQDPRVTCQLGRTENGTPEMVISDFVLEAPPVDASAERGRIQVFMYNATRIVLRDGVVAAAGTGIEVFPGFQTCSRCVFSVQNVTVKQVGEAGDVAQAIAAGIKVTRYGQEEVGGFDLEVRSVSIEGFRTGISWILKRESMPPATPDISISHLHVDCVERGLTMQATSIKMDHVNVTGCTSEGALLRGDSLIAIQDSVFQGNAVGLDLGFSELVRLHEVQVLDSADAGALIITQEVRISLTDFARNGLTPTPGRVDFVGGMAVFAGNIDNASWIHNSTFVGNQPVGLRGVAWLDARFNYWGSAAGPGPAPGPAPDQVPQVVTGDRVQGTPLVYPFLTSPP